jgi:hypothetical protein
MGEWSQDGDVEISARKTLPERPQRSHWKFNTKYTSKYMFWSWIEAVVDAKGDFIK